MNQQTIKNFKNTDFTVVVDTENKDSENIHSINFKAYIEVAEDADDSSMKYYLLEKYEPLNDQTDGLENAQIYVSGEIKRDGCSNIRFDQQDRVRLHFCDQDDIENLGKFLSGLYELAAEIMNQPDLIEDTNSEIIEDGFGNIWNSRCNECNRLSMQIIRPGKVQCSYCG